MKHIAFALLGLLACGDDAPTVYFQYGKTSTPETFWDYPFPSDRRLDAAGAPDMTGFPNPRNVPILTSLMSIVPDRRGFPVMSTAYFRFTAPIEAESLDVVYSEGAPYHLIDIDPNSPERGTQYQVIAKSLAEDSYVASNVLALAPRPGIVLRAGTQYAYVIEKSAQPGFARPSGFT